MRPLFSASPFPPLLRALPVLRALPAALPLLLLAACATAPGPTPYQPLTAGFGYSDQQTGPGRWRVSFAGNPSTPRNDVESGLMLRAAQLTLQAGGDWFTVEHRATVTAPTTATNVTALPAGVETPPLTHTGPVIGVWGGFTSMQSQTGPATTATADIRIGHGTRPATANTYDARRVVADLEPGRG